MSCSVGAAITAGNVATVIGSVAAPIVEMRGGVRDGFWVIPTTYCVVDGMTGAVIGVWTMELLVMLKRAVAGGDFADRLGEWRSLLD